MHIDQLARRRFPGIKLAAYQISGLSIKETHWLADQLLQEARQFLEETSGFFESPIVSAYRSMAVKSCGKESKIERVAREVVAGEFVLGNPVEDVVDLSQIEEGVVASVYDWAGIVEEPWLGLDDGKLVFRDPERVLSIVPCQDLGARLTDRSREILVVVFGNSETSRGQVIDAIELISRRVMQVAKGNITSMLYLD